MYLCAGDIGDVESVYVMYHKYCIIISRCVSGDHEKFKILSQPDDFNDDNGQPLINDADETHESDQSSDVNSLRNQFDEGKMNFLRLICSQMIVHYVEHIDEI